MAGVRGTLDAVPVATRPDAVLRLVARAARRGNEPLREAVRAPRTAVAAYRALLEPAAVRLRDLSALRPGLGVERAIDILVYYFGPDSWCRLVAGSGWSWDEAEHWLTLRATYALVSK